MDNDSTVTGRIRDLETFKAVIEHRMSRFESDAESEKRTKADVNAKIFTELGKVNQSIEILRTDLYDRIDDKTEKTMEQIRVDMNRMHEDNKERGNIRDKQHDDMELRLKQNERWIWYAAGAVGALQIVLSIIPKG